MARTDNISYEVLLLKDGRWEVIEICDTERDALVIMEGEKFGVAGLRVTRETFVPGRNVYNTQVLHEWIAPAQRPGPAPGPEDRPSPPARQGAPPALTALQKVRRLIGL